MKIRNFIIIFFVAFACTACGGSEERKAKYFSLAHEYLKSANYPKARVALRNVLKIDPQDAEAYYLFAQVEEKEKNWRNAVQLYQETIRLAPDHAGALITLAKYYLEAHLTENVVEAADKVLRNDPRHPQARALKLAAKAMTPEAIPSVVPQAEELAGQFPTEPDVAVLLATLYGQQQRYREAKATLRRALEAHPTDLDLLNNLSLILTQAKELSAVETVIRRMVEVEPQSMDHRVRLTRFYVRQAAHAKAEAVLRDAVALEPNNEQRRLILAELFMSRKDFPSAERVLLEAAAQISHSSQIQFNLASLYRKSGQDGKARERYAALVEEYKGKPIELEAKVKLAEMDLLAGKQADAERQVEEVLKQNPRSADGLILSGRMALTRRNGKDAVQAFRIVLHDQPDMAMGHYLLGQAYQLTGELNLAKESFEQAVVLYPDQVEAKRSLAVLDSKSGRYEQARARLDNLLKQRPDDLQALDMLMMVSLVTKHWLEAERTLQRLQAVAKESPFTYMAEGRLHQARGRFERAVAAYERAVISAPTDPDPLLSLVKLEVAQGHLQHMKLRMETTIAKQPAHLFAHGLLGEVSLMAGDYSGADAHFDQATKLNPKWLTPWLNWGSLWLEQKRFDQAVLVVKNGLKVNTESEELYMLLASVHSAQGKVDDAISAYDAALRLNPKNVLVANNLAVLLVDHKGDPKSLQKAFALSRDFEKEIPHPLFLDTLGWVRFKMGQKEEAIRLLKHAVAKSPDTSILNYHLGMVFVQSGKSAEARPYLSKALKHSEQFEGRQEAEQVLAQIRK
ncbi:MAG: tetratricopeptide repeat protein [Nitrospira sp.]|nr:tetratricopeptide repeat protein [Nitrospira sp.]